MSERALVTGGAGVIGRGLLELLSQQGAVIRCIDVRPAPPWLPAEVEYLQADLCRVDASAIASFAPTTLYHLAATFERSTEHPAFWHQNALHNVRVSQRLLAAAERCGALARIVFASSYLIYDPAQYLREQPFERAVALPESAPIRPRNVCGAAKLLHEQELELAGQAAGASFTSVFARIYRVYGRGSQDVIGRWVQAALQEQPIEVYGPESIFDYVFADDVARALALLGGADVSGPVNVATGKPRRVSEVIEVLREQLPSLRSQQIEPPERLWEGSAADVTRLREAVGWAPETTLERGIPALVEHHRERTARSHQPQRTDLQPESGGDGGQAGHWHVGARGANAPALAVGVLVTSASRKVPLLLAFREAFLALGLHGRLLAADADAGCAAALEADEFWHMPPLAELTDEQLLEYCRGQGVRLLVPTRDGELARFASLHGHFAAEGVTVAVSPGEAVEACADKLAYAAACARAGCAAVPTTLAPDGIGSEALVIKERRGAGSRAIVLGVTHEQARQRASALAEPVYQPFVAGQEHSVNLFVSAAGGWSEGVARRRDLVLGGESQVSTVVLAPELVDQCAGLASALGLRGHAVFQAIRTDDGWLHLECNPRVGGASALAFAAGLRTPEYLLLECLRQAPPRPRPPLRGLRLVRRPQDRILFP